MGRSKYYFLSTHLDDAVLSCGSLIGYLQERGEDVEVITFFTKQPNLEVIPKKMRVFGNYSQRLLEDKNAMEFLGVRYSYHDYFERCFVQPYLKSIFQCFRSPEKGLEGYNSLEDIACDIEQLLESSPEAMIYAPLGIGNHIDHTRLFFATKVAMDRTRKFGNFYFYEDAYGAMGNSIRKKHVVARETLYKPLKGPNFVSVYSFVLGVVLAFTIKTKGTDGEMATLVSDYDWKFVKVNTKSHYNKKIAAMKLYTSQMTEFGGEDQFEATFKRYHEFWDYSEPVWQFFPKNK